MTPTPQADEFRATFADWLVESVTLEAAEGVGFNGPTFAAPAVVDELMIEHKRRFVRRADGAEVVSETTLTCPFDVGGVFTVGDRITLPSGNVTTALVVATVNRADVLKFITVNLE